MPNGETPNALALLMAQPRKLHDKYFKQAKLEGYLARSAYKLKEIQERHRLIRHGDAVLDLGCAPGSWMQVASELAGPKGVIVGIDLLDVTAPFAKNVHIMKGDIFKTAPEDFAAQNHGRPFDVVISDMAPNTSGHDDDLLSARLCRRVLEVLPQLLKPGGNCTMKIFEGVDYIGLVQDTQRLFTFAKGFKPHACRDVSRETYIIATGYKASPPPAAGPSKPPLPPHKRGF